MFSSLRLKTRELEVRHLEGGHLQIKFVLSSCACLHLANLNSLTLILRCYSTSFQATRLRKSTPHEKSYAPSIWRFSSLFWLTSLWAQLPYSPCLGLLGLTRCNCSAFPLSLQDRQYPYTHWRHPYTCLTRALCHAIQRESTDA